MRILHTSDWHLGKSLYNKSMLDLQSFYIDHLVEIVQEKDIDVLIIAGDIYDTAIPSHEAVALLESAFVRLAKLCKVIVTSGNHDSAVRLGFGARLFENNGLYLRTRLDDLTNPVVLSDEHGVIAFYGIPFLHPIAHQATLTEGTDLENAKLTQANVMKAATDKVANHAAENNFNRTVVIAHAWFAGGIGSDSEKPISIGNLDNIPIEYVERFGYAALGHLHGPQDLRENVRYSGSPYPYSFGENKQERRSLLVEYAETITVSEIPVPQFKRLIEIEGTFDELINSEKFNEFTGDYIKANLLDKEPVTDAMVRLRPRYPEIVTVTQPNLISNLDTPHELKPEMKDEEIFDHYMEFVRQAGPNELEKNYFKSALASLVDSNVNIEVKPANYVEGAE